MTVRNSLLALSLVSLLAPAAASAQDGTIRFSGAIVEPAGCRVQMGGGSPAAPVPQVSCEESATRKAIPAANIVKVSLKALPPVADRNGGPDRQYRIVTLDYL
ncbi:hypothetical protein [Achromobacter marplatensis]|uniref:hypothetical protein n=1 Tax=Achromobacter marplatensis TaxID=470868 RepID=UPI0039F6873F